MISMLQRHGKKLFAVEARRPLSDFDTLGFSLSYELGCTNVLEMLRLTGVPPSWAERREAPGKQAAGTGTGACGRRGHGARAVVEL